MPPDILFRSRQNVDDDDACLEHLEEARLGMGPADARIAETAPRSFGQAVGHEVIVDQ